ncbi:MAG: MoaD/ThiS family protein [Gemmatimonadales bacterium]|nr:MoaD/ThiS family protein [Gemmatimonadales bacterium]MDZ4389050.1 MoaD/ThiS family protein [Gemmatimonadales bacterium]
MIRVVLPAPLRAIARIDGELEFDLPAPVTQSAVLDAVESRFPVLRGTLRDQATHRRRAFVRFYACAEDLSHQAPDTPLPEPVARGEEPLLIIGAMAGG